MPRRDSSRLGYRARPYGPPRHGDADGGGTVVARDSIRGNFLAARCEPAPTTPTPAPTAPVLAGPTLAPTPGPTPLPPELDETLQLALEANSSTW